MMMKLKLWLSSCNWDLNGKILLNHMTEHTWITLNVCRAMQSHAHLNEWTIANLVCCRPPTFYVWLAVYSVTVNRFVPTSFDLSRSEDNNRKEQLKIRFDLSPASLENMKTLYKGSKLTKPLFCIQMTLFLIGIRLLLILSLCEELF